MLDLATVSQRLYFYIYQRKAAGGKEGESLCLWNYIKKNKTKILENYKYVKYPLLAMSQYLQMPEC